MCCAVLCSNVLVVRVFEIHVDVWYHFHGVFSRIFVYNTCTSVCDCFLR